MMFPSKNLLLVLICLNSMLFSNISFANNISTLHKDRFLISKSPESNLSELSRIYITDLESATRQQLNFIEKIPFKSPVVIKCISDSSDSVRFERKAIWAKRLGIGSLIGILIPGINLLSLPAAIIAIALGTSSIKKVKNKKNARLGITFGIITTAFALVLIGIVVLVVSLGRER